MIHGDRNATQPALFRQAFDCRHYGIDFSIGRAPTRAEANHVATVGPFALEFNNARLAKRCELGIGDKGELLIRGAVGLGQQTALGERPP